ncbi:MAG: hypothetical protein JNK23_10020 [Opitutaceae bacterium]|nr:hypothetical protein [Opitutaceae bacterium]
MPRSFGLVDDKVEEAAYFLDRIEQACLTGDMFAARCDSVAFAASTRSVTFAMQGCLGTADGFMPWYSAHAKRLRDDPLAKFFHEFRRLSQHLGQNFVSSGATNAGRFLFYFQPVDELKTVPREDVLTACNAYFRTVLEVVYDCYRCFGPVIDGQLYFTAANFAKLGKTIEDAEVALGYPRGRTDISGDASQLPRRWSALRKSADSCQIQHLFLKWLGKQVSHPDEPPA